ncbi:MAG: hypothetical protein LBE67_07835 [Kocuria palustris]|nr:hypothetical protein [Kocuria palustris]
MNRPLTAVRRSTSPALAQRGRRPDAHQPTPGGPANIVTDHPSAPRGTREPRPPT